MADALIAFGGVVLGAITGAAGAAWIHRRELARAARVRIYDELLPALTEHGVSLAAFAGMRRGGGEETGDQLAALHRSAVLAGKAEVDLVRGVNERWAELWQGGLNDATVDEHGNQDFRGFEAEEGRLREALQALEEHLERRISRPI